MRFAISRAHEGLRQVIRQKAQTYDLTRPTDESKGRFGESDETTTTVTGISLYLFQPNEVNVEEIGGERLEGDLFGLSIPSADVEYNDRLTHGIEDYEVTDVIHYPSEEDQQIKLFSLEKITN